MQNRYWLIVILFGLATPTSGAEATDSEAEK